MKTTLITLALCLTSFWGLGQNLVKFEGENGKYGYEDYKSKTIVIDAIYEDLEPYSLENEDKYIGAKLDGKWGYINRSEEWLVENIYDDIIYFKDINGTLLSLVEKNDKFDYIDTNGKSLFDFKYEDLTFMGWLNENNKVPVFRAKLNNMYGYVTQDGKEIISLSYSFVGTFYDLFLVTKDNKNWGLVDQNDKTILPFKYQWHFPNNSFSGSGFEPIQLNATGKWSICDSLGNFLMDFKYDYIGNFMGEIAPFELNKKFGFINKKGEVIVEPIYDNIIEIYNLRVSIPVNKGAEWEEVMEDDYSYIERKGGKWGFINQEGNEITPLVYDEVSKIFPDGKAKVTLDGRTFFIDQNGNEIKE